MIQNTGEGGRYRYYCCSSKLKKGPSACRGLRAPKCAADGVGEPTSKVLSFVQEWRARQDETGHHYVLVIPCSR
jgi:hypothetical protein